MVAITEIDPWPPNTSAADVFHRGKAIARNIELLSLHVEIPAVSQGDHALAQTLPAGCARVTPVRAGTARGIGGRIHLDGAPVFDSHAIHNRTLHLDFRTICQDASLRRMHQGLVLREA